MHHTNRLQQLRAGNSPLAPFVLHRKCMRMCKPTHEDAVVQGLLRMTKDYYREPVKVVRLWVHECERVLADRMINDTDMTKFNEFRVTVTKKYFDDVNQVNKGSLHSLAVLSLCGAQPCLRSHFAASMQHSATSLTSLRTMQVTDCS